MLTSERLESKTSLQMILRNKRIWLFLVCAMLPLSAFAQNAAPSTYALVLAKPVSMKFVRDLESNEPDVFVHGAVYLATFRAVRTTYGSFVTRGSLKVELTASHV